MRSASAWMLRAQRPQGRHGDRGPGSRQQPLQPLGVAADQGERSAQLVGHAIDEGALLLPAAASRRCRALKAWAIGCSSIGLLGLHDQIRPGGIGLGGGQGLAEHL